MTETEYPKAIRLPRPQRVLCAWPMCEARSPKATHGRWLCPQHEPEKQEEA